MESPKCDRVEHTVAQQDMSSDEDDDMVICSSRDLERQQSVTTEDVKTEEPSPGMEDGKSASDDTSYDGLCKGGDVSMAMTSQDLSRPVPLIADNTEKNCENTENVYEGPESGSNPVKNCETADSDPALQTDENSNTQFCSDKTALEPVQDTLENAAKVHIVPKNVEDDSSKSEKPSSQDTVQEKIDDDSLELVKALSREADVSSIVISECPTATEDELAPKPGAQPVDKYVSPPMGMNKMTADVSDDAVVVSASWLEPFGDDHPEVNMNNKDEAITQLKSQVKQLTSVLRVKDETLRFIEEQTKAEVDKMSAEITLLRVTLVDEQKKVAKLEEDLRKKDNVIKKFKNSFERIGKAVAFDKCETDSKTDEDVLRTLTAVKDNLPGLSPQTSPMKQPETARPPSPEVAPPAAHGKSPSIPSYASSLPVSPSQGSLAPTQAAIRNHVTSPRMGSLGNAPWDMSMRNQYQPRFMDPSVPMNVARPAMSLMTPQPAHQKEKSNLPGQVTSFGEAMSYCVQKHMLGAPPYPLPKLKRQLSQGIPTTPIPLTGLPHGNQPSLPVAASSKPRTTPRPIRPKPAQSPSPDIPQSKSQNIPESLSPDNVSSENVSQLLTQDQNQLTISSQLPEPAAVKAAQMLAKKRSRRKNPHPVSIKRAKVECYQMFQAPKTPPLDITEPSVMIESMESEDDMDYEFPYSVAMEKFSKEQSLAEIKSEIDVNDSCVLPGTPSTADVFTDLYKQDKVKGEPKTPSYSNDESQSDSPRIVNVTSLANEFKRRRESLESNSDVNSPAGGQSNQSEDSEYETYANKPRHRCTFCQPSTSFSYCNDLLMHMYNQHKHVTCDEIQSYLISTVDVFTEQLLTTSEEFYQVAAESTADCKKGSVCRICLRKLPSRYMFILHMCTHTGERPYKCEFCSKRFVDGVTLWKHKKVHADEHPEIMSPKMEPNAHGKPYHCDECGKGFLHQGSLSNHRKLHIGWKPYKCEGCGKEFTRNASLMIHMRSHTKETPFKCQLCGKGFTQSCNLNTHLRIHRGEKPFHCSVCNKNFSRKFVLQKHRCLPDAESLNGSGSGHVNSRPITPSTPVSMVTV